MARIPFRAFCFFVEAAFGLVAQPFLLQHLGEEVRQAQVAAFVLHVGGHVADYMPENVETNEIDGASPSPTETAILTISLCSMAGGCSASR